MPVRRTTRKTVRRSVRKAVAVEEPPEMNVAEIRHHHNIVDLKVAIALAFVVVSSMFITVYAKTPTANVAATPVATSTGRLLVSPKIDYQTSSRILIPTVIVNSTTTPVTPTAPTTSITGTILAKWNVVAEQESVAVQQMRFYAVNPDYTVRANASEFGELALFTDLGVPLGTATMVGGAVQFNPSNFIVEPGKPQTLVLAGAVTGSGIMKENSIIRFGVNLQVANTWVASGVTSGKKLTFGDFKFSSPAYAMAALTPFNLYHNTTPVLLNHYSFWKYSPYPLNAKSEILGVRILAQGERDMRVSKLVFNVTGTGMNNTGIASTTGAITNFSLYESTKPHQLGQLVGSATGCLVSPKVGGPKIGTTVIPELGICNIGTIFLTFDQKNDELGAMDSLVVPANSARAFILVANTTKARVGKTSGNVTLIGQISGNTGAFPSSDPKKVFWGGGGVSYHYTPLSGVENVVPYNQSNSYPLIGNPMNF